MIDTAHPAIVCLQESKLNSIDNAKAHSFNFVRADGTHGRIVTVWNANMFTPSAHTARMYTLTSTFTSTTSHFSITLTNVYAPSQLQESPAFLYELSTIASSIDGPWLIVGDFNFTRGVEDRNNSTTHNMLTAAFNNSIETLALLELPLLDPLFTWSNNQNQRILTRLDRAFLNVDFSTNFPNTTLASQSHDTSDHIPLIITISTDIPK